MPHPAFAHAAVVAVLLASPLAFVPHALARDVPVSTATELRAAVEGAQPGDVILLADGTYEITGNIRANATGTAARPIIVRALTPLAARIRFDALEGFMVTGPYWTFQDLDIEGVCADHSDCEHAFHIVGDADHTVIRGNRVYDFNAHIKANGLGTPRVWPDDVLVEDNEFFNETPRATSNPVTPIDVVGGRRWIVRGNFIHDHQKVDGNGISYAAFLKGNSREGLIERNLVVCELLHTGGTRLGLSFGGGGSSPDPICEDGTCSPEHQNGVMRNNVIVSCPADVGIYVNECAGCRVLHNTLYRTSGIDVRFAASSVEVRGNVLSGRVRARDGATLDANGNLEMVSDTQLEAWFEAPAIGDLTLVDGSAFVDQGVPSADVTDDFCGNDRDDGRPDLGAVEYDGDGPCDTTMPSGAPALDGGAPMLDGGSIDASGLFDAGAPPRADTGITPASGDTGGCSCRAYESRGHSKALVTLGLIALALGLTRRTRRAPR